MVITIAVAFLRMEVFGEFLVRQVWTPLTHWFDGSAVWVISLLAALIILPILLWIVFRKKLKKYKAVTKITGFFKGMWDGLIESFKMPHKGMFFFLTALMWFLYVCTSYCTILATPLRDTLTFTDALFLMVVGSFGWVVPVQGGFGAFHFIVTLALVAVWAIPYKRYGIRHHKSRGTSCHHVADRTVCCHLHERIQKERKNTLRIPTCPFKSCPFQI